MANDDEVMGLGKDPKKNWPDVKGAGKGKPIDRLKPNSEEHTLILNYLVDRIDMSAREMRKFYPRWRVSERKYQAYISLPDWEQQLKDMNDEGKPPKVVSITIPYTFATISTIVTYLIHTFTGRKPMFQVGSIKAESAAGARNMEKVLQYNADHTRLIKHLFQFLQDGQMYGVGILRNMWKVDHKIRTVWIAEEGTLGGQPGQKVKKRENAVAYEGNEVASIDPYNFLPDPRVPMTEVARNGEFVFWRSHEGRHKLKKMEMAGKVKWVDAIRDRPTSRGGFETTDSDTSDRSLTTGGEAAPGRIESSSFGSVQKYYEIHQGTVEIIPAELGLGDSEGVEKWLFTVANKSQIIQAEPLALDHDMHPVTVSEPYTMGYSFGQPGMADYLNQIQDGLSWLINSHMDNVRTALNNMFVIDPSKVEIQDLKEPGAGKLIRLKKSAYGMDPREAVHQLAVQDVTKGHLKDFQLFMGIGDALSSITDNLRGQQDHGGRKTATEVRTAGEASASRLAAQSRLISAQAMVELTEMMSMNNQQNLSEEFFLELVGSDGIENPIRIGAEHLVGDFQYPIHDGTLPLDKVAMLDVWREIMSGVASDQELRQKFSLPKLFEFVAELGGAKNIESFKIEPQSQEAIDGQVAAGNAIPVDDVAQVTPGINANQGDRIQQ